MASGDERLAHHSPAFSHGVDVPLSEYSRPLSGIALRASSTAEEKRHTGDLLSFVVPQARKEPPSGRPSTEFVLSEVVYR
jgi:hypothetical protein